MKIDPALLFIQATTFGLAVLVLWRFFWKPLARFMEKRARGIEQDIKTARKSRESAEQLQAQLTQRLAEIDAEATRLLQKANDEGKRTREQILKEAQAEARRLRL